MTTAFLPFDLLGESFLIEAAFVREVLGGRNPTKIPHASLKLPGVFPWNGEAIPLLDLTEILELTGSGKESDTVRNRTIVVRVGEDTAGLPADEVREVVRLESSDLRAVHAAPRPFARAEVEWEERLATVIELEEMIDRCLEAKIAG